MALRTLRRNWLPYAILVVITLGAYSRLATNRFVSVDDPAYVTQNPHVLDGLNVESFRWAFTTFHSANWHPLTWLSHLVDVQIYGLNPIGHHATSLFLHIGNVLLLLALLRRMTGKTWASAVAAGLFAVHPLHIESVAWVAERKDVLSTFFFLSALIAYTNYVRTPSRLRYGYVFALLLFGLASKPMLVSTPLVMLTLDYWPLGRRISWGLVREKIPLLLLSAASCVITFFAQQSGGAVQGLAQYPLGVRLANAAVASVAYLVKMIWPMKLAVLYPHPGAGLPLWQVVGSSCLLAAVTWYALRYVRRVPYIAVGWLWYLVTLVPVIGLVQVGKQAMADRYTYIPLIGVFVALTWAASAFAQKSDHILRHGLFAAGTAVISVLAILTFLQTTHWKDGVSLFRRAVAVTPGSYMLHYCLADAYLEERQPAAALPHLRESIRLRPDLASTHDVLGYVLAIQGNIPEGLREIRTALRLDPRRASAWNNLGEIYSRQEKNKQAIVFLQKAIKLNPRYAKAHLNLGAALEREGDTRGARKHYEEAVGADRRFDLALCALGAHLFRAGDHMLAEKYLRDAVRISPHLHEARLYLGATLVQKRGSDEALDHLAKVSSAQPKWAAAHYYLSLALFGQRAYRSAKDELDAAVRYGYKPDPVFVEALNRQLINE